MGERLWHEQGEAGGGEQILRDGGETKNVLTQLPNDLTDGWMERSKELGWERKVAMGTGRTDGKSGGKRQLSCEVAEFRQSRRKTQRSKKNDNKH